MKRQTPESYLSEVVEALVHNEGMNLHEATLAAAHNAHDIARCYVERMPAIDCALMLCTTPPNFPNTELC